MNIQIPNLIIIGDVSYDTNKFYYEDGTSEIKTNYGGSSIYASVPASIFFRVGLVSNAGEDIDLNKLTRFNIDLKGLHQRKNERTTRFYNIAPPGRVGQRFECICHERVLLYTNR